MSAEARELVRLRALVAHLAGELARSWCAGSPKCRERWDRQQRPQPGDFVVETSTHFHAVETGRWNHHSENPQRFGTLVRVADEPVPGDPSEWDGPVPTERVWYVLTSDGTEVRWVNAGFAAVAFEWRAPSVFAAARR